MWKVDQRREEDNSSPKARSLINAPIIAHINDFGDGNNERFGTDWVREGMV